MDGFKQNLKNFLSELQHSILQEMLKNKLAYKQLLTENEERLEQLQRIVPTKMVDKYIETLYALNSYERNYYYLCGLRDANKQNINHGQVNDDILNEIAQLPPYKKLQAMREQQRKDLYTVMPLDFCAMLEDYENRWDIISELEKFHCYSGAMKHKVKLDKQFAPVNKTEWDNTVRFLL